MAPPTAPGASALSSGGSDGYLYYRQASSASSSAHGASGTGQPRHATSQHAIASRHATAGVGTIRYTCLPHSSLSPGNKVGWGGPHVTVGVRSLHCSPLTGPLARMLAEEERRRSGAGGGHREEKKVDDADADTRAQSASGSDSGPAASASAAAVGGQGSSGYVHPFRALPDSPLTTTARSADGLVAPQEFTVTATIKGLCSSITQCGAMSSGGNGGGNEISTGSVPLVPIGFDVTSEQTASNPPPTCMSTHVARFDLRKASNISISSRDRRAVSKRSLDGSSSSGSANVLNHGEELTLPLRYRDLSRDASIQFRVYAPTTERHVQGDVRQPGGARLVAMATLSLFDSTGKLRTGLQKLRLEMAPSVAGSVAGTCADGEADEEDPLWEASRILEGIRQTVRRAELAKQSPSGSLVPGGGEASSAPSTPSRSLAGGGFSGAMTPMTQSSAQTGYGRSRQQQPVARGLQGPNFALPNPSGPVPWLDVMTRRQCLEEINALRAQIASGDYPSPSQTYNEEGRSATPPAHLIIELPDFNIPIVHEETPYPPPAHGASGTVTAYDLSLYRRQRAKAEGAAKDEYDAGLSLVQVLDYENTNDSHNPVEDKYRTLAHDLLRGHIDPTLKPSRAQRQALSEIISSPSRHPTNEERDLLWRFRFHLVDDRRALSKFLLAVDWSQPSEVVQAAELLDQWRSRSPIEVTDALRLLGKDVSDRAGLRHAGLVREYAIETLGEAEDGELRLYLLQLVQAIKYEAEEESDSSGPDGKGAKANNEQKKKLKTPTHSLASFLIDRASRNLELANYFYWYLRVELSDPTHGTHYTHVFEALKEKLSSTQAEGNGRVGAAAQSNLAENGGGGGGGGGVSSSSSVQSHSYSVKSALRGMKGMGAKLEKAFLHHGQGHDHQSATGGDKSHPSMWEVLVAQDRLILGIMDCQRRARDSRGKKDAKEGFLRDALSSEGYGKIEGGILTPKGGSVPLPSAPSIMVTGVRSESVRMFKSALYPAVVEFNVGRRSDRADADKNDLRGREVYTTRSELSAALAGTDDASAKRKAAEEAEKRNNNGTFKVIVKTGDDLRQDQLVIMMIQLMDRLLKRATLDLCLQPYAILATSASTGLVEFVDGSIPISQVLANNNNSILQFFRKAAPRQGAKYGIDPDVMQTYLRSCAGYCVITYLLGVGDRHLDNIMLLPSGHFFHIE